MCTFKNSSFCLAILTYLLCESMLSIYYFKKLLANNSSAVLSFLNVSSLGAGTPAFWKPACPPQGGTCCSLFSCCPIKVWCSAWKTTGHLWLGAKGVMLERHYPLSFTSAFFITSNEGAAAPGDLWLNCGALQIPGCTLPPLEHPGAPEERK